MSGEFHGPEALMKLLDHCGELRTATGREALSRDYQGSAYRDIHIWCLTRSSARKLARIIAFLRVGGEDPEAGCEVQRPDDPRRDGETHWGVA